MGGVFTRWCAPQSGAPARHSVGQHADDVLHTDAPGRRRSLQSPFGRHHRHIQPGAGHEREHLRHHAIAAWLAQQRAAQLPQRLGQVGKRRAVARRAGLALQQRVVVLPVVQRSDLTDKPLVVGGHLVAGDDLHARRV